MYIIWTIIIGFIVGLLARMLMPGKDSHGFILTTLLGIAGAFVGAFFGQMLGLYSNDETAGLFMSVLGALLVLFLFKKFGNTSSVRQS